MPDPCAQARVACRQERTELKAHQKQVAIDENRFRTDAHIAEAAIVTVIGCFRAAELHVHEERESFGSGFREDVQGIVVEPGFCIGWPTSAGCSPEVFRTIRPEQVAAGIPADTRLRNGSSGIHEERSILARNPTGFVAGVWAVDRIAERTGHA